MNEFKFSGTVYQIVESLEYGDAVSNQVLALDRMMTSLGLRTSVLLKWRGGFLQQDIGNIDEASIFEDDLIILHFSGYSEFALQKARSVICTKILIYHNITPHKFFEYKSELYEFCRKGREQLKDVVAEFDYFWGDSQYNLDELVNFGAPKDRCQLVPIVVDRPDRKVSENGKFGGTWLFVGRIAENKGHLELVDIFIEVKKRDPKFAQKLVLVGGFDKNGSYYRRLVDKISKLGAAGLDVEVKGKVHDDELEKIFLSADFYVSTSKHEGFGVPLIEANYYGLPVLALENSAVGETLGEGGGLFSDFGNFPKFFLENVGSDTARSGLIAKQRLNRERFTWGCVKDRLVRSLTSIFPSPGQFSSVSIVICTLDRADLLDRCLDYLKFQSYSNFEVIVVNGPSKDDTREITQRYSNYIKYVENSERNLSKSRNLGIENASGDIVAFIDDDAIPFFDWVETIVTEFNSRSLKFAGIGGPAYYAGSLNFQAQDIGVNKFCDTMVDIPSSEIFKNGWVRSLLGTNCCYRRDVLLKSGGFDEEFEYFLDETELSFRLQLDGYIIGYCPNLFVRHEFAESHNRRGKFSFNWFSISKNTSYFISKYSGLRGRKLQKHVEDRMKSERILPLESAFSRGEITKDELVSFLDEIKSGAFKGLQNAERGNSIRYLSKLTRERSPFVKFPRAAAFPYLGDRVKRLHVCIISKEFQGFTGAKGGIGTLFYNLASELLLMGHYVTVISPGDIPSSKEAGRFKICFVPTLTSSSGVPSIPGIDENIRWSLGALEALSIIHKTRRVDVVETALWDAEGLGVAGLQKNSRPLLITRLVSPFPVVARTNNWNVDRLADSFFRCAEKEVIQKSDAVVAISEAIKETVSFEYELEVDQKWHKIYCGISYWPSFEFETGYKTLELKGFSGRNLEEGSKIILFLGRLESRKGIMIFLKACASLLGRGVSIVPVVAGMDVEGWEEKSRSLMSDEIWRRFVFLGSVTDVEKAKLLNSAYCLVFPSLYESFGLVPLESFVHGTPVIGSSSGAIPEVVKENVNGLLFSEGDSGELASKLSSIVSDISLRNALSKGAKETVRDFSSKNMAIESVRMYIKYLGYGRAQEI